MIKGRFFGKGCKDLQDCIEDNTADKIYLINEIQFLNPLEEYISKFERKTKHNNAI